MASAWLWLVPLAGLAQLALAIDNLRLFQRPWAGSAPTDTVAVLIPARDEGDRIGACVRAAIAQPEATIVRVLDDQSTDDTALRAHEAAGGDPRFAILSGAPCPPGWTGKNHACAQLASGLAVDWIVFLDADAGLAPGASVSARLDARLGLDGGEWLRALFSRGARVPVTCARATFEITGGVARATRLVFETARTTLAGRGSVDALHRRLRLLLVPTRHQQALLALDRAIRVQGPWQAPTFSLEDPPPGLVQRCVPESAGLQASAAGR